MDADTGQAMPQNEDPAFITDSIGTVLGFLQTYGWFILMVAVAGMYIKMKLDKQFSQKESASYKKTDMAKAAKHHEGLERARARMQEELDRQAALFVEKQREKEEKKRLERLEYMEAQRAGKSVIKKPSRSPSPGKASGSKQPEAKKKLRPDYNPLMGDTSGGGMCFRPTRRGGGG